MSDKLTATFRVLISVDFDDDGESNIEVQAQDALREAVIDPEELDSELVDLRPRTSIPAS